MHLLNEYSATSELTALESFSVLNAFTFISNLFYIIFVFIVVIVCIIIFNGYFTSFNVKHFELPLYMKCAILINFPFHLKRARMDKCDTKNPK